jgi:hypothetical protein
VMSNGVLVLECEGDGAAGEVDEGKRRAWAAEAVGASGDQPGPVVDCFDAALVDGGADRGDVPTACLRTPAASARKAPPRSATCSSRPP